MKFRQAALSFLIASIAIAIVDASSPGGGGGYYGGYHPQQQQGGYNNPYYNNQQQQLNNSPLSTHHYKHTPQYNNPVVEQHPPSPLDTTSTYRHDGLSIGHNFLRFQGSTFNKNEEIQCMNDLIIDGLVGRGVCSSVWKARRRKDDDDER